MRTMHTGPILIADITGYSQYLNESELVHAEQTLSTLLELLVEQTRPPLVVSKLEELPQGTRLVQRSGISDGPFVAKAIMKRLLPLVMKDEFQKHLDAFGEASERGYEKRVEVADAGS